ncbi:MAG: alginate lyase family protein [Tenuifilaceae bacterium]
MNLRQLLIRAFTTSLFIFLFVITYGFESNREREKLSIKPILDSIVKFEKERVIKLADSFLTMKPITVTADFCPRSAGGKHDYYSEGTYWWPNPNNPDGPYIQKDGQNNPDNFDAHGKNVMRFAWIVGTETSAYLLTGSEKYVKAALNHIKAWLVDTTTRMNPHMLYAQAIKGVCTGRGIGVIDAAPLIEVAQSIRLLENSPYATGQDIFQAKEWFKQYLTWLTTHKYGIDELNWKNNHGTWANCQAAAYARLVGNDQIFLDCRKRFTDVIIPKQMALDGSFPLEIARTKPFGYSLFNLDGLSILSWILTDNSFDGWNFTLPDGRCMNKVVEFMMPFIKNKNSWTYKKDVLYWEEQPSRQPFMIFAAVAQNSNEWFSLWKKQKMEFPNDEIRRNLPLKNILIWLDLPIDGK